MDIALLENSPIGRLVPIAGTDPHTLKDYSHFAFVPLPLPVEVSLHQRTWTAVAEATGSLGQLRQACAQLPNPSLLITPALAKEAQATSALEGTYGALPDVLEARLPGFEPKTNELREIMAYEAMARLGFEWIADRPITVGMLSDLQRILAEGSQRRPPDPGRVRTQQVIIGPENRPIAEARFVPPPPGDQLLADLRAWELWIGDDHGLPPVLSAAMGHYQFETLHPFSDGNGRVGRLVILLQLLRSQSLTAPSLTISPWLLRRREEYTGHLLRLSQTGDWNPWVQFFCQGIKEQCEAHVEVAGQMLDWMNNVRRQLNDRRWTGAIVTLSEQLIEWPIVTNSWVQRDQQITPPTAQSAISRLVEIGALKELTGRNYGRIYGAEEVMRLVESL